MVSRAASGPSWWRRHAGVRLTTSLMATLVVAVALATAGTLLSVLLRHSLTRGVEDAARQRAQDLSAAIAGDGVDAVADLTKRGSNSVTQVLYGDTVLFSSPDLAGQPPITAARPMPGRAPSPGRFRLPGEDDDHSVAVVGVQGPDGRAFVVVVAQSLESIDTTIRTLTGLLAVGMPLLVLLVAGSTFLVTGRALRPVEAIRRRVAGIDSSQLGTRVPVPPARDEVGRLAETMNDMLERLESAAAAQRRFVSDASHELRSPLATVRTTVEVARAHPQLADWPGISDIVLGETERLQSLVSDLLLLARTDEHGLQLRKSEVDLDDLCEAEVARLGHLGKVTGTAQIHPVRVVGDRDQLARLLRNLTDNAARHARSQVHLSCRRTETHAVVDIEDDGPGIPESERERVFERFVRLDESRARAGGGTGLGLAIAQQIARAHGAVLRFVEPDSASGAHVQLLIPLPTDD